MAEIEISNMERFGRAISALVELEKRAEKGPLPPDMLEAMNTLRLKLLGSLDSGVLFQELSRAAHLRKAWAARWASTGSGPADSHPDAFRSRSWTDLAVRASIAIECTGYGDEPIDLTLARVNLNDKLIAECTMALGWLNARHYDALVEHGEWEPDPYEWYVARYLVESDGGPTEPPPQLTWWNPGSADA